LIKNYNNKQIRIIKISKDYIKKAEIFKASTHHESKYFLSSWPGTSENIQLRKILNLKVSLLDNLIAFTKTQFIDFRFSSLNKTIPQVLKKRFKNLVITWLVSNEDFKKGKFYDRYFNMYAKDNLETLWIVLCDNKLIQIPKVREKNVILIREEFSNFFVTFAKIFYNFFKFSSKKNSNKLAISILDEVFKRITDHQVKNVILPYEAQPFQNYIFYNIHKYFPKINTYGCLHGLMPALPTIYIKRNGSPQKIIANGKTQKEILIKYLGWKTEEVKVLPSTRFFKKDKTLINQKILLSMHFSNSKLILSTLANYLKSCKNFSLPVMKIRNHPAMKKSKKHNLLAKKINFILQNNKQKFSEKVKKNISIFIGDTAGILEALERGLKVVHICSEPLFESFQKKIWKHLEVIRIDPNLFMYILKRRSMHVFMSNKKYKNLTKWIKA
tara:strand:+ start:5505 stop:6830 length:1326 start_codon:yes stop_codon:yes gene_type:complete